MKTDVADAEKDELLAIATWEGEGGALGRSADDDPSDKPPVAKKDDAAHATAKLTEPA